MSGCTIYLSATEPTHYYERAAEAGNKFYLVSYLYLMQRKALRNIERRKNENPDHQFIVDSGAHTLQGDDLKAFSLDDYRRYMDSYAHWLQDNAQYIHACVELDVESAVGMEQVQQWNNDFFIPFEHSGNNVIFVWHPERGVPEFEEMCKRHQWVGIAQDFFDSKNDLSRFNSIARKHLTKVHGFGITAIDKTLKNTFYSVDSTTWKGGEMYGVSYVWDDRQKTIKAIVAKAAHKRHQYRQHFIDLGLDPDAVIRGESRSLTTLALHSWRELQEFVHKKYEKPTYWDMRPPFPSVAVDATDEEAREYLRTTNCYDDVNDFDEETLSITYACFAAVINHDYSSLRENPELFEEFLKKFLNDPIDLTFSSTDSYLDTVCQLFVNHVSNRSLPRVPAMPRDDEDYENASTPKIRTDFPEDGLNIPVYRDIYRSR